MKQFHLDLTKKSVEFKNEMPRLTKRIANLSKNFFLNSFKIQGFQNGGIERWKARKGEIRGGIALASKKSAGSRALLVKSGDLRRSVKIASIGSGYFIIASDLPYSAIHNFGLTGSAWGKHSFKMPKRKFIGKSKDLDAITLKEMDITFKKIFK